MSAVVKRVVPASPAARVKVRPGDDLLSINGREIRDVLDYMYYSAESTAVLVLKRDKKYLMLKVRKSEYDDLGLEFETFLMDRKKRCSNKCVFCFIDQMPKGMRETLYFKDDDARLSFLQGNYVTLTNLEQGDIDRIIEMRLGINVSVHTSNPELRCKMMNNRFAGEKLGYLKQIAEAGLSMNFQIVLCPGLNDGKELRRTLDFMGGLMPAVSSIAVVPVGITKYREGLYPLVPFDRKGAEENLLIIEEYQRLFLEKYGTRLVYPSDEFYLICKKQLPEGEYYEGYPQYENGVGMLRSLYDEFTEALEGEAAHSVKRTVSVATGAAAFDMIKGLAALAEKKFTGFKCRVYKIVNNFFGDTITVAGLLTAGDIISQLKGCDLGEEMLLSASMFRSGTDIFLDDLSIKDVEKALGVKVTKVENSGNALFGAFLGMHI